MMAMPERDLVEQRIAELDARLARMTEGREILEQLRDAYARQLEFIESDGAPARRGVESAAAVRPEQPGPGSGQGSRRRASTSLSGSTAPAPDEVIACPDCGEQVKRRGLGVHRAKSKRHAAALAAGAGAVDPDPPATPRPQPLGADVARDRREIDELCPRGCGQRFRWEPRLLSHIGGCKGPARSEPGGGLPMISPATAGSSA